MNERHDHAWAGSYAIMEVFERLLLESEKPVASGEVYERLLALLEHYEIALGRRAHRLRPSKN
jgi:hypothetical protein